MSPRAMFTAPPGADSLQEKRELHSGAQGILPLAKSIGASESLLRPQNKETTRCFSHAFEDSEGKKRNLLHSQLIHEGAQNFSLQKQKEVESEPRSREFDPGRVLESIFVPWGYEFSLPGHGEPYLDCGEILSRGCLNVEAHTQEGLFEERAGKVFVELYKRTCLRAQCPICYESWAGKGAGKIEHRIKAWSKGLPIHLIVSPPGLVVAAASSLNALRRKAYKVAKEAKFIGGSCISHTFRRKCLSCGSIVKEGFKSCFNCGNEFLGWIFSPHFHMIGFGWIKWTKEDYEREGWVVKNAGVRESVSGTALYQLSHAAIKEGFHTVTWFGRLSYNNLKVPKMEREQHLCPMCGAELRRIFYKGKAKKQPSEPGEYWLPSDDWRYLGSF